MMVFTTFFLSCETNQTTVKKKSYSNYSNLESKNSASKNPIIDQDYAHNNANEILKIGIMLPLSGKYYQIGKSLLNSSHLALEKINHKNIVFFVADSGQEDKIESNFYSLIENEVSIVIGPVFTQNVRRVVKIAKENNVTVISLSNNSDLEEQALYVYGLTLEDELRALLDYSINSGITSYASILPLNTSGNKAKLEIEKIIKNYDSITSKYIFYSTENPDFYEISRKVSEYEKRQLNLEKEISMLKKINTEEANKKLNKLKKQDTYGELDFQGLIIITESFSDLSALSSILPYYDVDPKKIQFLGNSMWSNDLALKEPGLQNAYFTSLDIKNENFFKNEYISVFNKNPHHLSTLIYDLVGLLSKLHQEKKIVDSTSLSVNAGFLGLNGWFRFEDNGKVSRKPEIYQIKNERFIHKSGGNFN